VNTSAQTAAVMPMNSRLLVIVAGLSLVVIGWTGLLSAGVPTLYCPMPTLTVLPAFLLAERRLPPAALLVPVVLFFAWFPGLLMHGQSRVPKRTVGLIGALSILTIVDFSVQWNRGIEYRGPQFTMVILAINLIWLTMLWWVTVRAVRQPSFKATLLTHWLLFAWLSWYAFPYLGEVM
jgi:hypothetical protein